MLTEVSIHALLGTLCALSPQKLGSLVAGHFESPCTPNPCAFGSWNGMRVQRTRLHLRSK